MFHLQFQGTAKKFQMVPDVFPCFSTFDDNYLKRIQLKEHQSKEILPKTNPTTIPIYSLYDEFMLLFDETEKVVTYEAKAAGNKVDELKKIIDEATKDMDNQPSTTNIPRDTVTSFQGRILTPMHVLKGSNQLHKKQEFR